MAGKYPFKRLILWFVLLAMIGLWLATKNTILPVPYSFESVLSKADKIQLLDRYQEPLSITYQNRWNVHDEMPLHEIPVFLRRTFIHSEDKRFYQHHGMDWQARLHALYQNVTNLGVVRGASTISEQVIKMLHPRPRAVWSRWLEGWESRQLEKTVGKQEILQFYLNQIPYAANRRGVKQAARYYFDRDLETLSKKEMLALAVLVRAPSRLDIYKNTQSLEKSIQKLGSGLLTREELAIISREKFELKKPALSIQASHFIRHVLKKTNSDEKRLVTTLDGHLQMTFQGLLDQRLKALINRHVNNAALLVVDHQRNEVLAWVVAGEGKQDKPGALIDSITVLRQPGSALKPFLYSMALEKGWTAATMIQDSPLSESVGFGLHQYQNYSRVFYGPVSLREALGNSLNIPALRTIQYVGAQNYLAKLISLGFEDLTRHPDVYGDGLALGNAEVSLLQLVQGFSVLANQGVFRPLQFEKGKTRPSRRVFSSLVASLIGNILSDPDARRLEFGSASVLNLPVQTAVKTGTSSDFRDSWAVGFNDRYTVGVWMGNLNNESTDGLTGSTGPGLVLRSVFSWLNKQRETKPLYLSPMLVRKEVCRKTGKLMTANISCNLIREEYFLSNKQAGSQEKIAQQLPIRLRQPISGLHLAIDPRIPLEKQSFEFVVQGIEPDDQVEWIVDGKSVASISGGSYLWTLERGQHLVYANIRRDGKKFHQTTRVDYLVK